jgi:N-acyl-D-aspartate/D-glutamate deacylase
MGDRGAAGEAATSEDIERMSALTEEALRAGALGVSTSRLPNHRSSSGAPTPSLTASQRELEGIATSLRRAGRGVMQLVSDFEDLETEWAVALGMVRVSGRPLSMTVAEHFVMDVGDDSTTGAEILDRINAARADGLALSAQVAPRPVGLTMGLSTTLHPFMACPTFQQVATLPLAERVALLRHGAVRDRLLESYAGEIEAAKLGGSAISRFERMLRLDDPPDYEQGPEAAITAIATRQGRTPQEVALDVLLEDDGKGLLYLPLTNYLNWNLDTVRSMMQHPHAVPGLSDGGAHVGTICDGSFPTYLLSHWGLRRRGERLPIEFLVERQTRACARMIDLHDRGVLAPGYRADINVIDLDNLVTRRPEIHWDLPAGGRRFLQPADGYKHTFVVGVETYRDGTPTGSQPGKLIRGPQSAPETLGVRR